MKKFFTLSVALTAALSSFSQTNDSIKTDNSLLGHHIHQDDIRDKFRLYLHTKGSVGTDINNKEFENAGFKMDQLRIEMKGELNKSIYYRYQQRLTDISLDNFSADNLTTKIDYAGVGFKFNDKAKLFAGKMCTAYGTFEFDENPINVYQYSTIHENMLAFLTGVDFSYNLTPKHELRLLALSARTGSFEETYGKVAKGVEQSKLDLVYTINWNGVFGPNDMFSTRWSASFLNETKEHNMYYLALGTAANFGKFSSYLDLLYSREELDRKRIISRNFGDQLNEITETNVDYKGAVLGVNYRISPKVNLFAKGIFDNASKYKDSKDLKKGSYHNVWSYSGGIEYYPIKNDNLHINLTYIGRKYDFSSKSEKLGLKDYSQNRVELSFIYCMNIF
ncbi:MAG: porin [Bacteroidales bacterium]|nr:porin [Bacteroidales bacterium]